MRGLDIKQLLKRGGLSLVALLAVGLAFPAVNFAQTPTPQEASSGLQISPTRTELTIKPGQSDTTTISIKNITSGALTAKAEIDDFQPDNDTGTPQLLTNLTEPASTSIKPFVNPIGDTSLAVGESKKLTVKLTIPSDEPAGGYYGVLRFKAFPVNASQANSGKQVSLTASVGHIILVQVPGQLTEKLEAVSLSAEYHKNPSNLFVHRPDNMRLEVKNVGNSFLKPFGNVTVKNSKGQQVYEYEINATNPRGNILPKSTRVFHDPLKNIGSFGHYTALASVSYGNGGDVLALQTSFWVVPLWMLIAAGVVLLLVILLIVFLVYRFRRHGRGFKRP